LVFGDFLRSFSEARTVSCMSCMLNSEVKILPSDHLLAMNQF